MYKISKGESMKTKEQVVAELDSKIPLSAIAERDGGGGKRLSYLTGHYIIDRLNKVVGIGNWSHQVKELKLLHSTAETDEKGRYHTAYSAIVELEIYFPGPEDGEGKVSRWRDPVTFSDVGYGDGMDKMPTKCHELAIKEAVTDGIKRAAKSLGMSMGLALYDKEQVNVYDDYQAPSSAKTTAPKASVGSGTVTTIVSQPTPKAVTVASTGSPSPVKTPEEDREKLMEKTTAQSMVLRKVKSYTLEQVKELVSSAFGGRARNELSVEELKKLSETLDSLINAPQSA